MSQMLVFYSMSCSCELNTFIVPLFYTWDWPDNGYKTAETM